MPDEDYVDCSEHIPIVFVLDTSGSMNCCIDSLNNELNKTIHAIKNDHSKNIDVCIITFGTQAVELLPFTNILNASDIKLVADGTTNMRDALELALDRVRTRHRYYSSLGIRSFKPWIIIMTDGFPDPDKPIDEISSKIRRMEQEGKLHCFAVGIGDSFDETALRMCTDRIIKNIDDFNFSDFFSWLGRSVAMVSASPYNISTSGGDMSYIDCNDNKGDTIGSSIGKFSHRFDNN